MKLLSIDPGKSYFAWAVWRDERLDACGRTSDTPGKMLPDAVGSGRRFHYFERCVIELPQVYQQRKWKGDPNDLIQVALTVGAIEAQVHCPEVELVKPHTWKGSVPKDVMAKRIVKKLSDDETAVLAAACEGLGKKRHDVVDAVGIGLWALGRLR